MPRKMPNFFDNSEHPITPTNKIEVKPVATQNIHRRVQVSVDGKENSKSIYDVYVQHKENANNSTPPETHNPPTPSLVDNTNFELEQINMKINSLLQALDNIQTDIVKYKIDKHAEELKVKNQGLSFSHYFRAFLMFVICIGGPWFVIEVFSWRF